MSTASELIFVPKDEHSLLVETFDRLLAEQSWFKGGWRALWRQLADAGLLGAALPEADGGFDDCRALALCAERLGRAGATSPFIVSAIVATSLLHRAGMPNRFAGLRERLVAGEIIASLEMPAAHGDGDAVRLTVDGLSGMAQLVPFAAEADLFIIAARADDGKAVLAIVPRSDVAIEHSVIGIDGAPYATVRFDRVRLGNEAELARGPEAERLLTWTRDALVTMHCAEALGAMSMLVDMTSEYLKVRNQFGEPLSAFQVLRHRLVDMDMALTESRSVVEWAAGLVEIDDESARRSAVTTAHFTIARAALKVSQDSVQLHGGIGMANETPVGGYFKRLMTLPLLFGDEDSCAESYLSTAI
jgi:alkylation response protein AidB-like acyl-CoA dehydrogenase